jgi:hypothetical protein
MMWWTVVVLALLIPLIAVVLDSQLGRALAARLERDRPASDDGMTQRIAQLEAEVERLSGEVLRLEEETSFLHRLLEQKPTTRVQLPPGE